MEAKNEKLITVHSRGFTATPVSIECSGKTTVEGIRAIYQSGELRGQHSTIQSS